MNIQVIEEEFEYNIKQVVKEMRKENEELSGLSADEFQDTVWKDGYYCEQFAHKVIEKMFEWSGDNAFEPQDLN